jgi:hypothetical protein
VITLLFMAVILLAMLAVEAPLSIIAGIVLVWILVAGFGRKKR